MTHYLDTLTEAERRQVVDGAVAIYEARQPRYVITNTGKLVLGAARLLEARGLLMTDIEV